MLDLPATLLTLSSPGDPTLARLTRKVSLITLRRLLSHPLTSPSTLVHSTLVPRTLVHSVAELRRVLVDAVRRDKPAVLALLAQPVLRTPLLCLEAGLMPAQDCLAQVGPALLVGLVRAGLLGEPIVWEHPVSILLSSTGCRSFDPPATALAALASGVDVQLADGRRLPLDDLPATTLFPVLCAGLVLATADSNPLAQIEAHPDKHGNSLSLGGRATADWVGALDEALNSVRVALPEWWTQLPLSLWALLPVGYEAQRHLSASYREAPGLAYLSLHDSTLTLAEAIVHEAQHSRLNLLTWLDPVLKNAWTQWTQSPVRPDLRPLMGVLLAAHAFVPVAALHARLADLGHPLSQQPGFAQRRAEVLQTNRRSLAILQQRAQPTDTGRRLLTQLNDLHQRLEELAEAPVP